MEVTGLKRKHIIISILVLLGLILSFFSFYTVRTGEVAVVSRFGKINRIAGSGLNFKLPFIERKIKMETREKIYYFSKDNDQNTSIDVSSKDIQSINIELTVQASISDVNKLFTAFDGKHESRFIRPRVREIVQATISKYTIEEFVTKRTEISNLILEDLKDDFEVYGLTVSNISITNHDFSDEYEKAVESKKVAEQGVEKAKAEQQKISIEAENKIKIAEFKLKEKELEAQANLVESKSLTKEILKSRAIEKWNGEMPKALGSGVNTFLNEIIESKKD